MKNSLIALFLIVAIQPLCGQEEWYEDILIQNIWPTESVVVDIDGDGDQDVLVSNSTNSPYGIAWYENDGSENFEKLKSISLVSTSAYSIHAADLDDDGDMDIVGGLYSDMVVWLENDGEGNFGPVQIVSTVTDDPRDVYCQDLDGDGDLDIISASSNDDKIAWYENDGEGNFSPENIITLAADNVYSIHAQDLDGDGDIDVVAAVTNAHDITWYENDGEGNFGPPIDIPEDTNSPQSIYAEDIDGDGDFDLVSASYNDDLVAWHENDGTGTFLFPPTILTDNLNNANDVKVQDLNGDGDMDIVAFGNSHEIQYFINEGGGVFDVGVELNIGSFGGTSIAAEDLNDDGDIDIIFTSSSSSSGYKVGWYEGLGNGGFTNYELISQDARFAQSVFVVDLNNDNDPDILSASKSDDEISWYENLGNGTFGLQEIITSNADGASSVFAADLNLDLLPDVIYASQYDNTIAWFENLGNGNFGSQNIIADDASNVIIVRAADMDGDGDIDVIGSAENDWTTWYENLGNGVFISENNVLFDNYDLTSLNIADIDDDGDRDLLASYGSPDQITWFELQNGNMAGSDIISNDMNQAEGAFLVDIDGDGDVDVVASSRYDDLIVWFENDGSGEFGDQLIISSTFVNPGVLSAEDIDSDGDMDVICGSYYSDEIVWFRNDGIGNFGEAQLITSNANGVFSIATNDIDNDGNQDLIAASINDGKVAWYKNFVNYGCMDSSACNYDSEATIDEGCCYGGCGCTNPNAINYDSTADCDIGTCVYEILGFVFNDLNANGSFDTEDYGLPLQEVVSSNGEVYFTNDEGYFYANLDEDAITLTLSESDMFPYETTPNPVYFENGVNAFTGEYALEFGVSSSIPDFAICVDYYPIGSSYPCDVAVNHNICFRNMGNVPISGTIEIVYDPLFQDYIEVTPIDSVIGNTIFMSFDDLPPGVMFFYDIMFVTPTADFLGEVLVSNVSITGFYEGDVVAFGEEELAFELTCAYDPNDKQVFPVGYTDQHYVEPEQELEYLVRFQNTGNAPATNVIITDTIDEYLDLSTFTLMANSHSVITTLNTETRAVEFFFENIMLPDSTNNEPESHGLVSYVIRPYSDAPYDTPIYNTAFIYFDNNEPIITNTTWTTLYECTDELAAITIPEGNLCPGSEVLLESEMDLIEEYLWTVDGLPISEEAVASLFPEPQEEYIVELTVSNPVCVASSTIDFHATSISGDANADGTVNVLDLVSVSLNFGCDSNCFGLGDANGDGQVNVLDVVDVSSNYGSSCD